MAHWHLRSASEQLADHLRSEVIHQRRVGLMPGIHRLAAELGVNRKTVEAALRLLEGEGLLLPQGVGRRRRIARTGGIETPSLRVAILINEASDRKLDYMVELQHELAAAGHAVCHVDPPMVDLGMDVRRIARVVNQNEADAWVVMAGSREVLQWFASCGRPAFALFGRRRGLVLAGAGPDKPPAIAAATRRLLELGHRRVVLLARPRRRLPEPGASERAFLAELTAHGFSISDYNLPHWEETVEGFHVCLESLFHLTPPTAMIIDEVPLFAAAQQFLGRRRLRVPEDISLVSTDYDPSFDWCVPTIAHIRWDSRPVVRRIVRWAANVSRGKTDLRQTSTPAEFVSGGTVGPVASG
jgi:DNA-binding LacI/PurR family transcriptional regulator/predicted transcriptional regulator